jgi:S1-C subfamily serine protease
MNTAQAVDHIRPSIVQISFLATGLSPGVHNQPWCPFVRRPLGTGFLVNSDGFVVTARHVVQCGHRLAEQIEAAQAGMVVGLALPNTENMRGNFRDVGLDLVDEDAAHDLALLKLRPNPFSGELGSGFVTNGEEVAFLLGTATLNPSRPRDGDAVGVSGYPLGQSVLVTNAGWMATSWSFEIAEAPVPGAPQLLPTPHIADTFLADLEANPGNSGGPVYLIESASVIGVCVGSMLSPVRDQDGNPAGTGTQKLFYSSGLTIVVPARYVTDLLSKHGLSWSEPTNSSGRE